MPSFIQILWSSLVADAPLVYPQIFLVGMATLMLWPGDLLIRRSQKRMWANFASLVVLVTAYLVWQAPHASGFSDMYALDPLTKAFQWICLLGTLLTLGLSRPLLDVLDEHTVEFYSLMLFALSGMLFLCGSIDLVSIYFSIELMALPIYVLVGYLRHQDRGIEAGMKYFLLGSFASAITIYGISLIYGATGGISTNLTFLQNKLPEMFSTLSPMITIGVFMILIGIGFKVAAVPFHMWTPDAYDGAPTPVTAFMASAPKAAALLAFVRIFNIGFQSIPQTWIVPLGVMAAASMLLGNIAALRQQSMKRMLAYSSIAHVGYILLGVLSNDPQNSVLNFSGVQTIWLYLFAYLFMNFGAFAIVNLLQGAGVGERIEDFKGLAQRSPLLGFSMMIFLLSLAGIPPLIGFFSKFILFKMAIERGFITLTVIAVLTSAVSAYYYLGVINQIYFRPSTQSLPLRVDITTWTIVLVAMLVVLLGIPMSGWLVDLVLRIH